MQLLNGDCLQLLQELPDGCVDLVVTDPPYFQETNGGGCFGKDGHFKDISGISDNIDLKVLPELVRVMKKINIYIFCSKAQIPQYFDYFIKEKGCNFDILTWHKTNAIPAANNTYMSDTEYLLFFREKGVKVFGNTETKKKFYVTPINGKDKERFGHPTPKPLEIIENLVTNSSIRGGCVLDPFMGSGTTGVACKKLDREFIGMELDEGYFQTAKKRIEETGQNVPEIAEQMKLF